MNFRSCFHHGSRKGGYEGGSSSDLIRFVMLEMMLTSDLESVPMLHRSLICTSLSLYCTTTDRDIVFVVSDDGYFETH